MQDTKFADNSHSNPVKTEEKPVGPPIYTPANTDKWRILVDSPYEAG